MNDIPIVRITTNRDLDVFERGRLRAAVADAMRASIGRDVPVGVDILPPE